MRQALLQIAIALLQKWTVTTNCDEFITKMRLILQNRTLITNCGST